jgi:hypothetical protein
MSNLCVIILVLWSYWNVELVHSESAMLRFMILADWGKGGSTGSYGTRQLSASPERSSPLDSSASVYSSSSALDSITVYDLADGNSGNNGGGSGGGGGGGGGKGGNGGGDGKQQKQLYQLAIAKAMNVFASTAVPAPEFILALGDNFYGNGVKSATDSLWDYLWKDVYLIYESLYIPWFASPGNHDYNGNVQAQIDRSNQHKDDDIWMMPSTNFTKRFKVVTNEEELNIGIVFIDTQALAPYSNDCCNEKM